MNAYRIPGRAEIDDVAAEARRDVRRARLQERLRFIDALIGSPERTASAGSIPTSAAFGAPFVFIGATIWWCQGDFALMSTLWLVGLAFVAFGLLVASAWSAIFRLARVLTRRSLAKLE